MFMMEKILVTSNTSNLFIPVKTDASPLIQINF